MQTPAAGSRDSSLGGRWVSADESERHDINPMACPMLQGKVNRTCQQPNPLSSRNGGPWREPLLIQSSEISACPSHLAPAPYQGHRVSASSMMCVSEYWQRGRTYPCPRSPSRSCASATRIAPAC